ALAGGVGGARLAAGLAAALDDPSDLTVIVNTGDDFEHLGLSISPDLDTVMYTLASIENPDAGWGRRDETWSFMATLEALGGPDWFRLGDHDMAVHAVRTQRLRAGSSLSHVTLDLSRALGVRSQILPMSDDPLRTIVATDEGTLEFQHYFVRRRCEPRLLEIRFQGINTARAGKEALAALSAADLEAIVIAPSNPYVSIAPILALNGMRQALERRRVPLVAVSPIIAGRAVKGPAAKMMAELGVEVSALGIARHYAGLIDGLVIDEADCDLATAIASLGISVHVTSTLMRDDDSRRRLAVETLGLSRRLGAR
ncbi:MAG: 2-phospho-L-lactate transferase, partial [Hyphomicrobiaceae bacterium]